MKDSSPSGNVKEAFQEQFLDLSLLYEEIDLGNGKAHAFFVDIEGYEVLEESWQQIVNLIAINFQNKLEKEFERWNIYLFFRLSEAVDKGLKYKIENDTFSCRKIIIDKSESHKSAVEDHILNKLVNIGVSTQSTQNVFEPNKIIQEVLKGKTLKKINTTPDARKAYDLLVEKIINKK
ncbi:MULTISPECIES: ABC-three component system middle component 1 [Maribacter]|jgi:ABC-three component (ABC-3C) system Middle Component 1|uniref:ABC-three component system middle component 1 n=2 Tax=Maribacter cobaltidurans TaxID=1178778 RepID=A0ABU7IT47_9FLAO|nr:MULTISPECIES: ABC-three component system middle component 1 [Maribacter]ASV32329.1 hypothetical protein CJ263_20030 [Maribacter cobaltidurans]MDC6388675.1 hypothetical protein [Maribacter sp. PR1]MEE1976064.1 ABC-three component system middle component 1 [Maribacter cobaltidurans]GGD94626.1 hypothetical protein GCM10011412_35810 [Maribacter cobaltidurans]